MRIAYILPAIIKKGPVIVVFELVVEMLKNGHSCKVYYFDELDKEDYIDFKCPVERISMGQAIDFTMYDVVHSNMMRPDKYIAKHREYSGKVTYVSTIHCYIFPVLRDSYNWLISEVFGRRWIKSLKAFDRVAVLSNHAKNYYKKWIDEDKIFKIYNTRRPDISKKLDNQQLNQLVAFKQDSVLIGINANLLMIKGIDIVINALTYLPNYKFFIVGDGPKRKYFEQLAKKKGVDSRCYFAGYQNEAYRYLEHYDIYVSPSRSEGFPLSVIEAAFYNKPLVVSDLPIFKETIEPDQRAIFELANPHSIVSAIQKANQDKNMGANLRSQYDKCFSPDIFYQEYISFYNLTAK